jgi:23S rRNA (uracil1939-C5)-methyltransferase
LPGFDVDSIEKITASLNTGAYRNRVKLVPARSSEDSAPQGAANARHIKLGLYRAGSHEVVDIPNCPVQAQELNRAIEVIRTGIEECRVRLYDEVAHTGDLRFVTVREGMATGELLIGFVTRLADFPGGDRLARFVMDRCAGAVGVVQNVNTEKGNVIFGPSSHLLAGRDYLDEVVCGVRLRLGLTSFFQVNTPVAEKAYEAIVDQLEPTGDMTVFDLYSGVGAVGLVMAPRVGRAIGVEEAPEAIDLALAAAQANGIGNAEFHPGLVEDLLPSLAGEVSRKGTRRERLSAVVNPPRKGLDPRVVRTLVQAAPGRIAYLSCSPPTLIRDLGRFIDGGYAIRHVELFDMFPQTEQVETLAVLELPDRKGRRTRDIGKK